MFLCMVLLQSRMVGAQEGSAARSRSGDTASRSRSVDTASRPRSVDAANRPRSGDTTSRPRSGRGLSVFFDTTTLTTSDYQLQIEITYAALNNVENSSVNGLRIQQVKTGLPDCDSALKVIKDNLLNNSAALNVRILQVFRTLLQNIQTDLARHRLILDSADKKLQRLRQTLKPVLEDTILRTLMRDSTLRAGFAGQLKDLRPAFRAASRQLRESVAEINTLQTRVSSNNIASIQLLEKVNNLLGQSSTRIFRKEHNYLWERDTSGLSHDARQSIAKAYAGERKAVSYYFKDGGNKRFLLLLLGISFLLLAWRNIRSLKKRDALAFTNTLSLNYLPNGSIVATLVVVLCIAPLVDLHAPSAYIEGIELLLVLLLTLICWSRWPGRLFIIWLIMAVLYVLFSLSHHITDPGWAARLGLIALNVLSVVFGQLFLKRIREHLNFKGFLRFVIILHNLLNIASIVCNVAGRFTLAQMLGNAAIFSFIQVIGLAVFSQIIIEALLLQVLAGRVRSGKPPAFNHEKVVRAFQPAVGYVVVLLWLIVFTTNLNIYNPVLNGITHVLSTPRQIGTAHFTFGGLGLFFLIIWFAHLLQKNISYLFGDADDDEEINDKGQRSRLLITRLILLCLGYFLAIAASGVPIDKITIVLGALSVGIGLGLQNIVTNFVSGIILIFDKPLQIGDIVQVGIHSGRVRQIGLRASTLMTAEGAEVIIPNGDILSTQIVNRTLSNNQQRLETDITVTGSADIGLVTDIIRQSLSACDEVSVEKPPQVLIRKVMNDGFELKILFWIKDAAKAEECKSETTLLLYKNMKQHQLDLI